MPPSDLETRPLPANPERVRAFATFFKNYMSVSAIATAALPVPLAAFHLIPTYGVHTNLLSIYTSMFCFLLLAYVFSQRHRLASYMFPDQLGVDMRPRMTKWLPIILIFVSLLCAIVYHGVLESTIRGEGFLTDADASLGLPADTLTDRRLTYLQQNVPRPMQTVALILSYLGIFLAAESAFILMAIQEYLQDILGITDIEIITGQKARRV